MALGVAGSPAGHGVVAVFPCCSLPSLLLLDLGQLYLLEGLLGCLLCCLCGIMHYASLCPYHYGCACMATDILLQLL